MASVEGRLMAAMAVNVAAKRLNNMSSNIVNNVVSNITSINNISQGTFDGGTPGWTVPSAVNVPAYIYPYTATFLYSNWSNIKDAYSRINNRTNRK